MTNQRNAWSVRGVSREVRTQAKTAARRRRVTTGEWISRTLIAVADEELTVSAQSLPAIGESPTAPMIDEEALKKLSANERAHLAKSAKKPGPSAQTQQPPWSIRGVSDDARAKLVEVAAHRGVTAGEWVNHAIQVHADREASADPENQQLEIMLEGAVDGQQPTDAVATGDPPKADSVAQGTLTEVEILELLRSSDAAVDVTSLVTIPKWPGNKSDQPLSEIADRVAVVKYKGKGKGKESDPTVTSVQITTTHHLHITGDPADGTVRVALIASRGEPEKEGGKLSEAEILYWESIKDSREHDDYISYLECFPDGLFASLARRRLERPERVDFLPESPSAAPQPQPEDVYQPLPEDPSRQPPMAAKQSPRERKPLTQPLPKFDYETLSKRAVENTKRKN